MPQHLIWLAIFIAIETLFFWIARRCGIGAGVNERSSHTTFTPTAGGVIVPIAIVIFAGLNFGTMTLPWWIALSGAIVLAVMSFIDDIKPLSPTFRLIVQTIVVGSTFYQLITPHTIHYFLVVVICGVGTINAINFIDGIRAMLAFYGLVVLGSLLYAINTLAPESMTVYSDLCLFLILAIIAFSVFNIRDKIFAGDVGAITLGFIIVFVTVNVIFAIKDASIITFFIVAIFDAGLTTLQRLFAGENILMPHRDFIYEVLTSRWKLPHLIVSSGYATLQLVINTLYFLFPYDQRWAYFITVSLMLMVAYFYIRRSPKSRHA